MTAGNWAEGSSDLLTDSSSFAPNILIGVLYLLRGAEKIEVGEVDGVDGREYTTTMTYDQAKAAAGPDADVL